MDGQVVWFEIPVADMARARAFYSALFGAELPLAQMNNVLMAFFPSGGGALIQHPEMQPSNHGARIYLQAGDDLNGMLERVEPAGGTVLSGKTLISQEFGHFALFLDSEGNRIGLHSRG